MDLFKKIVYFILSLQEKLLTRSLNRTIGSKSTGKRKKYFNQGCLLSLDTLADSEKQKIEDELLLIIKSSNYNPAEILEYIKNHGTNIFYIDNAKKLHSIGENEGFILPAKGYKAIYLSLLTENNLKIKTNEMFILTKGEINKYYFMYHLYNWYAYKHGIEGLDSESQELLKKYLFNDNSNELVKLQLDEIYKLKDAIKLDKSAIEFVFKMCRNIDGAQNAFKKLKDNGTII